MVIHYPAALPDPAVIGPAGHAPAAKDVWLKWTNNNIPIFWRLAYLAVVTAILFFILQGWFYDDTFITFRYALNLSIGRGMVYNLGQHTLSTTSPLFALLLAVQGVLWPGYPDNVDCVQ